MRNVSFCVDRTTIVVDFVTPTHDWIFANSFSRLPVDSVRTFSMCVPSPVMAWHSRISSVEPA